MSQTADLTRLAGLWRGARSPLVFTGAGVSTQSGIPDYRSPGGQWTRIDPPTFGEFRAGEAGRRRYWRYYQEFFPVIGRARPNPGHLALARLAAAGRLAGVVTQNIDGLHQAAGLAADQVWELHGNAAVSACLDCGRHQAPTAELLARFEREGQAPLCPLCGGALKPRTISFGQNLDEAVLEGAAQACATADLLLVVGSSLVVTPAASLPGLCLEAGGRLAIVNLSPTHLDEQATVLIRAGAAETLAALADLVLEPEDQA